MYKILFILYLILLISIVGCSNKIIQQPDSTLQIGLRNSFEYLNLNSDENDCGVIQETACLKYLGFNISRTDIIEKMGWKASAPNITDTPFNHKKMLDYFGISHTIKYNIKVSEIKNYLYRDFPVIVLLKTGTLKYHWVTLTGWSQEMWLMSWGLGKVSGMSHDIFNEKFKGTAILFNERLN